MSTPTKVLVVGPTGRTGGSVLDGLLDSSTNFEITTLVRQASVDKPEVKKFKDRGVTVVVGDLRGPKQDLVKILSGIDVVVSCIVAFDLGAEILLAEAAKEAGVKRFVPSSFQTPGPRGVMILADRKDEVLSAVQRLHLPWTLIDVGWWSNQIVPPLPSGRTKKFVLEHFSNIPGDGTVRNGFTDLRDVGKYVAKIIVDPRTLNKKVYAYTEVSTMNQVVDLMSELSGEEAIRDYLPAEKIQQAITEAQKDYEVEEKRQQATLILFINQYWQSWGVRGDNTPEAAEIFGYLDFKKLYPDVKGKTIKELFQGILDGSETPIKPFQL
ncbi:isoflavone reductase [Truncatella angustata]|uniref:Isoflavone reductase n=1 Tax=Truncatella angustata TaxID=152316 RepID=A0A9P8US32_9PEZI|nr:isoflavone reductase [Truncatella angustata]KAH6657329.1 isoflavone reductase [Truncatella angustata]KAH8202779.1 hypothetical protein TruAng_003050 [Truncatella angustata]